MSIDNLKSFYESLGNEGEMNKQCCQNDTALPSTMKRIKGLETYQKTHNENNEITSINGYFKYSQFSCVCFKNEYKCDQK